MKKETQPSFKTTSSSAPAKTKSSSSSAPPSVEKVRENLSSWVNDGNKLDDGDSSELRILLKDYDSLKDKVTKLKSLLGRSAKAQREAKVELEATQKRLDQALREIDRLQRKIDKLANRPTHMELLADFETNFDRALLSVGQNQHQPGGQDTASQNHPQLSGASGGDGAGGAATSIKGAADSLLHSETAVVDSLLMQELNESKQRIEKLESLNAALLHRSSQLEGEAKERKRERDDLSSKVSRLELEKRMAVMEAEHATREMEEKAASLKEMQMEIDLVTKASVKANTRAHHGEEIIKSVKTDKQHVQQLEAKVQALQEWALASSEAKNLAQERVRILEGQLRALQGGTAALRTAESGDELLASGRILLSKSGSLVVGAGDSGVRVLTLPQDVVRTVRLSERVILRWQFDLIQEDATIEFSILKSDCETPASRSNADYLIKDRMVTGGAAGETENAFAIQNACTLLWSNAKAWIRPKTVKFSVTAVALEY
jgi:hypothetical protein